MGDLDAVARDLASGTISRRTALRRFAAGAAAASVPGALLADPALAKCPDKRKCGSKCCPKGAKCTKKGKCKCKGGRTKCGKQCVDLGTDPANCGSCGRACSPGQTCANGQCVGGQQPGTEQPGATQVCGNGLAEGSEQCDGADLRGATCTSLGLGAGTLACNSGCAFDTSGCTPAATCGNDQIEGGEVCDGNDLGAETCESLGFTSGTLACSPDCQSFDTSGCTS